MFGKELSFLMNKLHHAFACTCVYLFAAKRDTVHTHSHHIR